MAEKPRKPTSAATPAFSVRSGPPRSATAAGGRRGRRASGASLAVGAAAVQLEAMGVDHEPGGAFDGLGHGGQVTVADVGGAAARRAGDGGGGVRPAGGGGGGGAGGGAAARRADDVVVVIRPAGDVGVLAVGEVDALDGVELDEDVESPEDRGAAGAPPAPARKIG